MISNVLNVYVERVGQKAKCLEVCLLTSTRGHKFYYVVRNNLSC